jgi:hypothetical protein
VVGCPAISGVGVASCFIGLNMLFNALGCVGTFAYPSIKLIDTV